MTMTKQTNRMGDTILDNDLLRTDLLETNHFLSILWNYTSHQTLYYEILYRSNKGRIRPIFFDGVDAARKATEWLEERIKRFTQNKYHIWFGVLPRIKKPEKGRRGSNELVDRGQWLWVDLDYKKYYTTLDEIPISEEARQKARQKHYWYEELEDHALIGVYYDEQKKKWVYVNRPALSQVIKHVEEKTGLKPTIVVDSGNGYHIYFKLMYDIEAKKLSKIESCIVDILGGDPQSKDLARVLRLPGTINPRINRKTKIIYEEPNNEYDPSELEKLVTRAKRREEIRKIAKRLENGFSGKWRRLTEEQKKKIVELLKEAWEKAEGQRFDFVGSLAGLFAKSGIAQEDCEDIVRRLYMIINRPDMEHVEDIKYTYKDYMEGKNICAIECDGEIISGMRPLLERLLGEDKGQITLLQLQRIISNRPRGSLAWLKATSNGVKEWIDRGRSGIYIRRITKNDEVVYIRISRARIKEVKRVKIVGLERLKEVYKVELDNGQIYIGVVEDLARDIRRYYGLKNGTEYALSILFDSLAEEYGEEELFYSPGPWIVNDKINIAEKPGYIVPWKRSITWKLVTDGDIKQGLIIIKRNVEAYKDPHIASTIMSYGIIAWAAHWFKNEFSIFPHIIIWGPRGKGKTYILELLALIYGFTWSDYPPTTDFQARRELSTSTIPYILTEGNDFFRKLLAEDKGALSGLAVLSKAATDIELRESGGYNYGGIFLGIRAFMTATNIEPERISTFDADKFILIRITKESSIDLSKVYGITPKAIKADPRKKKDVASVFSEILKIFEKKIPDIRARLIGKAREELVNEYINIGYEIWKELFEKYGLEPFPEPAKVSLENQVETIEDRYREAFYSYLARKERNIKRDRDKAPIEPPFRVNDIGLALESLDYHMGVIYEDENGSLLILKPSFLSEFSTWAEKTLGLQRVGWRRLAEILGLKFTTWTIKETGQRIKSVLVKYI